MSQYVHGYTEREAIRLGDQAKTLADLLHHDSIWGEGEAVLEAGCGVGSQTKVIATKNPRSRFVSVDISDDSLAKAMALTRSSGVENVRFAKADIFDLPFEDGTFDHVLVCFVLEHLRDGSKALAELKRVLKPGGTITAIEGDHGSAYFYPDSRYARAAIQCQVDIQAGQGGDAHIGRKLYPMLKNAGFGDVEVSPRMVYADESRPELVEGFTRNTFTAMIEGIREKVLLEQSMREEDFDRGVADLHRTAGEGGVFCYTFFKGIGVKW
jgi:ubiquinone/menaquinone biosynthesis C-methylase UbiE